MTKIVVFWRRQFLKKLIRKETPAQLLFYKFCETFKNSFLWNTFSGDFYFLKIAVFFFDIFW